MVLKEEYPELCKIGVLDALICALEIELIRKNLSCAILSSSSLMRLLKFILSIFQGKMFIVEFWNFMSGEFQLNADKMRF